jgi:RHS repeat-associated protein
VAQVPVTAGTTNVVVAATDYSNNTRTNTYQVSQSGSTTTYTYDQNGNLASDGTRTFEWDAENRLTAVKQGATTLASFTYDGKGRRAQKIAGGVTHTYIYEGVNVIEERVSSGQTYDYVQGPGIDRLLAMRDQASVVSYYLADHLGSIAQSTSGAGAVTLTREYDPWGNPIQGSTTAGYAFTGREWDSEIGAYYYRARYYDPKISRFISEDPIGFTGGVNFYSYVAGNPTNLVDPFGLIIQICYRPAKGMPGNHAYLYDPRTCKNCGRGANSGGESPGNDTTCVDVPGTERLESTVLACCESMRHTPWASPWMFRPLTNDCHNFIQDALQCAGIRKVPPGPGRFGRTQPPDPAEFMFGP